MKVLLLSRYGPLGASSRVRFLQYLPYFHSQSVEVTVEPLLSDVYLRALYDSGSRWGEVVKGYCGRILALLGARRFDVVIIEKELFPFMPAIAERFLRLIGVPYVVDYDDALFHRYDCHSNTWVRQLLREKIDTVMRHSSTVIAGNDYLAERARRAGVSKVEIIPTVVNLERYQPKKKSSTEASIVGWIGTPQTSRYLKQLLPIFKSIQEEMPVRFIAVGAREEDFAGTSVETWPWSEETEVESIQQFDIGIMPLQDSPWERGKCGYKLIQYMACGIPVVASPVGVNCEIVEPEKNGLLADSVEEWDRALRSLLSVDCSVRDNMGANGRKRVEEWYSLQAQAPRLLSLIRAAFRQSP
ncbi:glycosyltransferase family 4 protein [Marinobacter sp. UBA2688]|uniref:glycosyltransferase family 4 protein n=1 Tax=Marinobacter sp. UBA2688 TaxID=1946816 RepID=UPI00257C1FF8|nr:glycosyltransferase family 4 protein [Marinobacter sp. UBA2688]|tara:strand:- start:3056 stop:4126 length:1071 start_codon:yes stop_codon:yes gene_type:complete